VLAGDIGYLAVEFGHFSFIDVIDRPFLALDYQVLIGSILFGPSGLDIYPAIVESAVSVRGKAVFRELEEVRDVLLEARGSEAVDERGDYGGVFKSAGKPDEVGE
jgi:hypothetical protein